MLQILATPPPSRSRRHLCMLPFKSYQKYLLMSNLIHNLIYMFCSSNSNQSKANFQERNKSEEKMKSIFLFATLISLVWARAKDTNPELPIPVNYCPHWFDIRSDYVANYFVNEKYQARKLPKQLSLKCDLETLLTSGQF